MKDVLKRRFADRNYAGAGRKKKKKEDME